jgi:hypothetical protein
MLSKKKSFALFILMVSSSSTMLVLFNLIVFAKPYILITSPHIFIGLVVGAVLLHQGIAKLWRMTKTDLNQGENKQL